MATPTRTLVLPYVSKLNKSGSKELRIGLEWVGGTQFETCIQLSGEKARNSIFLHKNKQWSLFVKNIDAMISYFDLYNDNKTLEFISKYGRKIVCGDVTISFTFTHPSPSDGVIIRQNDTTLIFQRATLMSLFSKRLLIDGYDSILQKYPVELYIKSIIFEVTQNVLAKRPDFCCDYVKHYMEKNYEEIHAMCSIDIAESHPGTDISSFILFWNDIVENNYRLLYTEISKNCRSFV